MTVCIVLDVSVNGNGKGDCSDCEVKATFSFVVIVSVSSRDDVSVTPSWNWVDRVPAVIADVMCPIVLMAG